MAEVFVAKHIGPFGFQKRVVIKRILRSHAEDDVFVDLFLREARLSGRLNHPNVVQTFELIDADGEFFLVMEHLEGMSWRRTARTSWCHHRPLDGAVILSAIEQAARGLHHAHTLLDEDNQPSPVFHRDISEDNLFFTYDGATKVLDFGIATSTSDISLTQADELRGKVPYMSPEQIEGKTVDARSDIWSLGVTLFWLLTGQRPFDRARPLLTMDAILNDETPDPRAFNPGLPTDIVELCTWALQKKVDARPQSAAAFAERCAYVQLAYGIAHARGLATSLQGLSRTIVSKKNARHALREIPASVVQGDSTMISRVVPGASAAPWTTDDAPHPDLEHGRAASSLPDDGHSTDSESDGGLTRESVPFSDGPDAVVAARVIHEELTQLAPSGAGAPIVTEENHPLHSAPTAEQAGRTLPGRAPPHDNGASRSPWKRGVRHRGVVTVVVVALAALGFSAAAALLFGGEQPAPIAAHSTAAETAPPDTVAGPTKRPPADDLPRGNKKTDQAADVPPRAKPTKPRRAKPASSTKTRDTKLVDLKGPRRISWSSRSGRPLQRRKASIEVPTGTTSLVAIDPERGSTHRVPIARGVADFGALPQRKVRFLALPARAVVKYKTGKVIGTIPFSPVRLKVGSYAFRFVFDDGSVVNKNVELKAGNGEVRVEARHE